MRKWIKRIIQEALEEEFCRLRLRIRQLEELIMLTKPYITNIDDHNIQSSPAEVVEKTKETRVKNVASNVQR